MKKMTLILTLMTLFISCGKKDKKKVENKQKKVTNTENTQKKTDDLIQFTITGKPVVGQTAVLKQKIKEKVITGTTPQKLECKTTEKISSYTVTSVENQAVVVSTKENFLFSDPKCKSLKAKEVKNEEKEYDLQELTKTRQARLEKVRTDFEGLCLDECHYKEEKLKNGDILFTFSGEMNPTEEGHYLFKVKTILNATSPWLTEFKSNQITTYDLEDRKKEVKLPSIVVQVYEVNFLGPEKEEGEEEQKESETTQSDNDNVSSDDNDNVSSDDNDNVSSDDNDNVSSDDNDNVSSDDNDNVSSDDNDNLSTVLGWVKSLFV